MLKATINAEIFRESIDAIAALVTECRLHTAEDLIRTRSVDTANVAMVSLELQSTAFNSFSATAGELGLDIAKLKNIIGMMGKGDALTLNLLDEERKLELSFGGYRYSISLLDVNTIRKDPNPPGIDLPGKVVVPGDALNNAIKAAAVISDKIALGIDPDAMTFYMEAEGDTDQIKLALGEDELVALNPVQARSLFSIDYLKDMGRVMARADEVEVYLGIDHPVRFVFDIADGNGRVEYLLAPRIEAD
ncbi:DNA polymerase sliding clamp [Methanoculleus sp. FWC-SCC3]|uniref:DNA polymerase sliding clamp n=1 Tax=Methanoculleus methanifontis TaxID=2584086 RepID=A0ABT8M1B8_9EURY|nr:DNA polymerase sliding clamp [Methanoculleus sp. FWC-SCC3]MDN7012667.1 DNA polymerase sliding clamp [Methanoculleus sp. FWC-SCC3]